MAAESPRTGWWRNPLRDVLAGTVAGIAGKLMEYPFDTVKVRMQAAAADASLPQYRSSWECFARTVAHEGVRGLFKGMGAPLAGTIVETSCLFWANGWLKRVLASAGHLPPGAELPMRYVLLAGAGTGFVVSFVLTPIELIKCRLQMQSGVSKYTSPWHCLTTSVKEEGLAVVYRGHVGTMLREVPGTAFWFGAYETFVRAMTPVGGTRDDVSTWAIITAGALGGVAYWGIMYPCDTVKSMMQIAVMEGAEPTHGAAPPSPPRAVTAPPAPSSNAPLVRAPTPALQPASKLGLAFARTALVQQSVRLQGSLKLAAASRSQSTVTNATPSRSPPGFAASFLHMYRTTGIRGLYAGLMPTLLRAGPSNAAIFVVYEWTNTQLKQWI